MSNVASTLDVLVVDDEINIRKALLASLQAEGHRAVAVANITDAQAEVSRISFDLAIVDLRLGAEHGLDLLQKLRVSSPWMQVVIMTAFAGIDSAVEAMRSGAFDYLAKPFSPAQLKLVLEKVSRVRALEREVQALRSEKSNGTIDLESKVPAMSQAIALARQVAASDATVLLRGESGTGKGVLAKAIHQLSSRADHPFVTVACPSLSAELLESELFGHVRGAFTGALRDNPGRVAAASGGTLFLDEIGDLPLALQPKLLRFVQDREYERIGESTTRKADVRIIAATNVKLEDAVAAGRFREDLYYRLNVISIELPPLRERADDIASLAQKLLIELTAKRSRPVVLSPEAVDALRRYPFPGNVRELRNVLERAAILCTGGTILEDGLMLGATRTASRTPASGVGEPITLERLEELHIRAILSRSASLEEAAATLGVDSVTLWRKRKKFGID